MTSDPAAAQPSPHLVLGSSSPYRRALLGRLIDHFEVLAPRIDETPRPDESPAALVSRLALEKALAVAAQRPQAVVIGSDQAAECEGRILGKPGSVPAAIRQLVGCAGRTLSLLTAVCVVGPGPARIELRHLDRTLMHLRPLSLQEITRYVERDQPLDCAGSFRFESLGAALFESVESRDPTAIEGLPLLWVASALTSVGVRIL